MNIPRIVYPTRSYTLPGQYKLVVKILGFSFGILLIATWAGADVWMCAVLTISSLLVTIGLFTGRTEFILDDYGLSKQVRPYLSYKMFYHQQTVFFEWREVLSFKTRQGIDTHIGREYEYLEIHFMNGTTWQIFDYNNRKVFLEFKNIFLNAVKSVNQPVTKRSRAGLNIKPPEYIVKKKGFHFTPVQSKVFFVVIVVFILTSLFFFITHPQYDSGNYISKALFEVLPGMGFVGWWLFRNK